MKKEFDLEFCFKGNRKYVHGTDIFTKVLEKYDDLEKIDIAFHGITINNLSFSTKKPNNKDIKVSFRALNNNEKIKLYGFENEKTVICQYEYLEEDIVNNSRIDNSTESVILDTPTKYSFIEHIVAMNKALLEKLYNDVNGKWYFTRLQIQNNIEMDNVSTLQLVLKANFQFKLTKTALIVDNKEIGFIYFSLIPKEA